MWIQTQESLLGLNAACELHGNTSNIAVKSYRYIADNCQFAKQEFRTEIQRCLQEINVCRVGAITKMVWLSE